MRSERLHRLRPQLPAFVAFAVAALVSLMAHAPASSAAASLSIAISGNHFVNGSGQTIRLLGVNHPSSEYACVDGFGYNDGHMDDADAAAIASWNANAVRIPLNEDCWLGINGQPNSNGGASETLTRAGYRQAVENYVAALNAHGLYAILDLHWTAPGTQVAEEQQPMPDEEHSPGFWESVAQTFKSNPAVVFDVFNEPFDPTDPRSGEDPEPQDKVSWSCWENGGCDTEADDANGAPASRYAVAGMQGLVDTIRSTGATQPIMVGGLDFANDLSQWVEHAPDDPLDQEAASFHNYMGKSCDSLACWTNEIAPVAAHVPVVTGEFDEDDYAESKCADKTPSTFDQDYMNWSDQHGVSYLAWGWIELSQQEQDDEGCSAFYLIENYGGTPAFPNGTLLHDHLLTLPAGGVSTATSPTPGGTTTGTTAATTTATATTTVVGKAVHPGPGGPPAVALRFLTATVRSGGRSVSFALRSPEDCSGTLTGQTVSAYAATSVKGKKRRPVSLGTVHFALRAGKTKTVVLVLSKASRRLLAAKHQLEVQITITLAATGRRMTVVRRTMLLSRRR
jgi:Cellulase (glycosyl hydrolase family 5)